MSYVKDLTPSGVDPVWRAPRLACAPSGVRPVWRALCAELVNEAHHGMAFGVLATVNGIGDFLSSAIVGLLWSVAGKTVAFGYSAALFLQARCW